MYTIGTAGHVDHGKSALVLALTGIDPDRLREEKERGLTIELGFAPLTLPGGQEVSIVDVPGHERFIKTMLAGVGGIDLALLVIATDDGVMPQTREHLAIIDLLGIDRGVIALSKADLTDEAGLAARTEEIRETLAGTTLDSAQIVACSALTGDGLDTLLTAIENRLTAAPQRADLGRMRLPVDRVFTMPGFGTVVTGTLSGSALSIGDEIEVLPSGAISRIRGMQVHGRAVETAEPGRRTAVNLANVALEEVRRGDILAHPGEWRPATAFDARLRAVPYLERPVRHNLRVTVHLAASEVPGRLVLLDAEAVAPGQSAWVQLRLDQPLVAMRGDRFIIRDPNDTLGGGEIVDTDVLRHRRNHLPTLAALEALHRGEPEDALFSAIGRLQPTILAKAASHAALNQQEALTAANRLIADTRIVCLGEAIDSVSLLCTVAWFDAVGDRLQHDLNAYHLDQPSRRGMPREELRSRAGVPGDVFDRLVFRLTAEGVLLDSGATIALSNHSSALTDDERGKAEAYVARLLITPYAPPTDAQPATAVLAYLEDAGRVVRVGNDVVFAAEAYEEMVGRIRERIEADGEITLAGVRDMFGTTRKYAQPLLEHLDSLKVTRRVGDVRVLARRFRASE